MNYALLITFLLMITSIPCYSQADDNSKIKNNRILLKIPYEDRENLLNVMRNNLNNLNKMINAMADDDFEAVQNIAKSMSFNKKKGKGLSRRGNAAFIAKGVKFHAQDTIAVMTAAETKDRKATLRAISNMVNSCVSCHSTFRVMEWPNNKVYKRPSPMKLNIPNEFKAAK